MSQAPALPNRPLFARPPAARFSQAAAIFGWLVLVGGSVAIDAPTIPDLYADLQVRDAAARVRGGHLESGRCHTSLFVHTCNATLSAPGPAGGPRLERSVSFAFATLTGGDFEAMVVADPARPELLTTDLALDHFWDRVLTLLANAAILVALLFYGTVRFVRTRRDVAMWRMSPAMPAVLRLHTITRSRTSVTWTVQGEGGATAKWTVPHRAKAFTLGAPARILGLRRVVDGAIMPLDAGLRWVDLSDAERATALAPAANQQAAAA